MQTKTCIICGEPFEAAMPHYKTCSPECRHENKKKLRIKANDKRMSTPEGREKINTYMRNLMRERKENGPVSYGELCSIKIDIDTVNKMEEMARVLGITMSDLRRMAYKKFVE